MNVPYLVPFSSSKLVHFFKISFQKNQSFENVSFLISYSLFSCLKLLINLLISLKPCSDERQNGFKSLKLKRKFLQPSFTPCEHDCFCLKTLKHFRFKCLRPFLSLVQMKDKMVLSCLKLKQNSFKPLRQSIFTFTTKTFWMFKTSSKKCIQKNRKYRIDNFAV